MVFCCWLFRAVLMQSGNSITRDRDELNWVKWLIIIIINGGILSPDRFPPLSSRTKTHHGGNLSWWEYAVRPRWWGWWWGWWDIQYGQSWPIMLRYLKLFVVQCAGRQTRSLAGICGTTCFSHGLTNRSHWNTKRCQNIKTYANTNRSHRNTNGCQNTQKYKRVF